MTKCRLRFMVSSIQFLCGVMLVLPSTGYAIMPSTIRLSERGLFTAIRCRDEAKAWIETYRSLDNGQHWKLDTVPAPDLGTGIRRA